jgi:glutaredoxin-related protein
VGAALASKRVTASLLSPPSFADLPSNKHAQVFVKGEFIGGSDILMEMHKAGELTQLAEELQQQQGGGTGGASGGGSS